MAERDLDELLVIVYSLRRAIQDEGSHPAYHRMVMRKHRKEWPTLWVSIDAVIEYLEKI